MGYGPCEGICVTELHGIKQGSVGNKTKGSVGGGRSLYAEGYRFCGGCGYYFITEDVHCKCCGRHLRFKPRHQARYRNRKGGVGKAQTFWVMLREKSRI